MTTGDSLLGVAERLLAARQLDGVLDALQSAQRKGANPDRCAAVRWTLHMLLGEFEQAWQQSDAIRARKTPDPHRFWHGESLHSRRVMLRCLHGFGDAVQFLRYAPRLRAIAESVTVEVHPRFVDLARYCNDVDGVISWGASVSQPVRPWDVQIEVMELPYMFRTQLADLPLYTQYIRLPPHTPTPHIDRNALNVGFVTSAGDWNPSRSIPMSHWSGLLQTRGCTFWNLDAQAPASTPSPANPAPCIHFAHAASQNIVALASAILSMNLVITVDTLAAHLAGALGVPCWVLLQYAADWRWMHNRPGSPWYPSLRLFRQPVPGDWPSVLSTTEEALARCIHTCAPFECIEP